MYMIKTKRGYRFDEASSAMQKAIRRNDPRIAGYFAIEFFESGMSKYVWKRLLTISAEDCAGVITQEVEALRTAYWLINDGQKVPTKGRIFIAKAVLLLCAWPKSRDSDHLTNLIYDRTSTMDATQIEKELEACRGDKVEIPEYALDCHTARGKAMGKKKKDFFKEEHEALKPRQPGLFDADLEKAQL